MVAPLEVLVQLASVLLRLLSILALWSALSRTGASKYSMWRKYLKASLDCPDSKQLCSPSITSILLSYNDLTVYNGTLQ